MIKQHIYHSVSNLFCLKMSNCLWGSYVLLFPEFINIVSILFYNFTEFVILLYTFLVFFFLDTKNIWFDQFCLLSFQIYYQLLLVKVQSVWLGVNILSLLPCLLKSRILSTILIAFLWFLFSGISLLLKKFLKSINK